MRCPQCQTENAAGARFCRHCGARLFAAPSTTPPALPQAICAHCQAPMPLGVRFCRTCGKPRAKAAVHSIPATPIAAAPIPVTPTIPAASTETPFSSSPVSAPVTRVVEPAPALAPIPGPPSIPPPSVALTPVAVAVATPMTAAPTVSPSASEVDFVLDHDLSQAKLICTVGSLQGMSFRVGSNSGLIMGRSPGTDVRVPDPEISKTHCWVGLSEGRLVVRDLKSTNGTYLNDRLEHPVSECELQEGDVLVLGRHNGAKFRVSLGD